ncbi:MAG: L,D-transpeptidase [Alphaproteobacteria bacterium]|nr:L,D-transpeptidase [Alphaproteobacteria bacterium]MBU2379011.1 L,D-transpeptidase [Alphaproteobacteria bacterium]
MIRPSLASALLASVALAACGAPDPDADSSGQAAAPVSTRVGATGALSMEAIEGAVWQPAADTTAPAATRPTTPTAPGEDPTAPETTTAPRPEIIRAQILLDRARFSPGSIDGLGGENTGQAIAAFEKANDLPVDGELDERVFGALTQGAAPVLTRYTITAADVAGPFRPVPKTLEAQAELSALNYASAFEGLAEKFHVTEALLSALNPDANFEEVGRTIVVPAVSARPLPAAVARIEVNKSESSLRAFDAEGVLLAFYPATIGSTERPAPTGRVTVVGVAPEPNYTYDPSRVTYGDGERRLVIAAGPNNPVGSVWIDLSKDTYGIHGTPEPSKIAKTASSGCVRLTNWDAEQLAAAVKPGVEVIFS